MLTPFYAQDASLIGVVETKRFRTSFATKQSRMPYSSDPTQTLVLQRKDLALHEGGGLAAFVDAQCTNQDAIVVDPYGSFMLFDGVSHSPDGAGAARLGAQYALEEWNTFFSRNIGRFTDVAQPLLRSDRVDPNILVRKVMKSAHDGTKKSRNGEAANALAFLMTDVRRKQTTLYHANVGDCGVYRLDSSNGILSKLSTDDSLLMKLVRAKQISKNDAWRIDQATDQTHMSNEHWDIFNQRNGITQALDKKTPFERLDLHIGHVGVSPGDKILLVCDGITDSLVSEIMQDILYNNEGWNIVEKLMRKADEWAMSASIRAKPDDMSFICCEIL